MLADVGIAHADGRLRERPRWVSHLLALALTLIAIGLRRGLDVLGDGVAPFVLFIPVVIACTLIGGASAGLLSLSLAALAATAFWLETGGILGISEIGFINFLLFLGTAGITIVVADRLRSAHYRLRQSEARLNLSQEVGQIGVWEWDLRSREVWWSPTLYMVTGISPTVPPSSKAFLDRIDREDAERVTAAIDSALRGIDKLRAEFRFVRDDGTTIWLAGRAELLSDQDGKPSRLMGVIYDVSPIRTAESERDRANSLLRTFFDSLPGAAYAKDAEGRILLGNPGFEAAVGYPVDVALGKTDIEYLADADRARAIMENDRALMREMKSRQIEEELVHPDGRVTHWLSIKTPFTNEEGEVQGIVGISLDVTERRKAEERLLFLANEVDHRAKNLLGVVQSVVRLTKVDDVDRFKDAVTGRIQALARAHTLLAESRWQGVDIATLVNEELAPFTQPASERIRISGPPITLEPNASQVLAVVMHELAMNAAIHGALSSEDGRLTVTWQIIEGEDSRLEVVWEEAGAVEISPPSHTGFGSTAIRGSIEHQLEGNIEITWAPTGVTYRIVFPVANNLRESLPLPSPSNDVGAIPQAGGADVTLIGKRVLIVDDEALIALTLKETVEELGCEVIGPAGSADAALGLIRQCAPDIAILDVNLTGANSAPIARALRALAVPFIYCTGYAEPADQIDPDLRAEVLVKPVDPAELAAALPRALANASVNVAA